MKRSVFILLIVLSITRSLFSQFERPDSSLVERFTYLNENSKYKELIRLADSTATCIPSILEMKAGAQQSLGYITQAKETIRSAISNYSDSLQVLKQFAGIVETLADHQLSLDLLDRITRLQSDPVWMEKKAQIAYAYKDYENAIAICDSIQESAYMPSAIRLKARSLAALKQVPESMRLLEKQHEENPDDYLSMKQLATLYLAVDSVEKLVDITEHYLQNDSSNAEIVNLNAKGNYLNNNFEIAVERYLVLEKLVPAFDFDQNFFAGLANYHLYKEYPIEAYQYFIKADSLSDGKFFNVKYLKASTADKIGRPEEAYLYFTEAFDLIKPDTTQLADIHNKIGQSAMKSRKPDTAVEHYKQALKYNPDDEFSLISIGLAYDFKDDTVTALNYYRQLLKIVPDTIYNAYGKKAADRIRELQETDLNLNDVK